MHIKKDIIKNIFRLTFGKILFKMLSLMLIGCYSPDCTGPLKTKPGAELVEYKVHLLNN